MTAIAAAARTTANDAGSSEECRQNGGQPEDAAPDNAIHGERGQAPAADGANQSFAGRGFLERFGHREFVSQIAQALAARWACGLESPANPKAGAVRNSVHGA